MKKSKKLSLKTFIMIAIIIILLITKISSKGSNEENSNAINSIGVISQTSGKVDTINRMKQISDWRIVLVNKNNPLPNNFEIELVDIDEYRQFDSRAIDKLNKMISDMKNDGVSNIWVQSAYRTIKTQQSLFDNSVNKYIAQGKSKAQSEELTLQAINRAGESEHNLGLAVDFNYVDNSFEKSKAFNWLLENAENYGFILRYAKDKESITGVKYEPWHWRYVGVEHAKIINESKLCLEEYIEYLSK